MDIYTTKIIDLIKDVEKYEKDSIAKTCDIMYEAMKNDLVVHVFATGHSHMFAEELFYRAGGLVQINPILEPFLMQHEGAVRSTQMERIPGIAKRIYDAVDKKPNEPFIIVSNSGINSVPVEMAQLAKEDGRKVITLSSVEVSKVLNPRTLDKVKLYQVGDVTIDNHSPYGDGVIKTAYGYSGSSSTILNSYIAQALVLGVIERFSKDGLVPPIYQSANCPGGDEHNKLLYERFKNRIRSLY